jgi:hypothetical protein
LRQGDAIASLLFNIVLEFSIRRSKVETRGTIFEKCTKLWRMLMVWLLWEKIYSVEEIYTSLAEHKNCMEFKNQKKKKIMTITIAL